MKIDNCGWFDWSKHHVVIRGHVQHRVGVAGIAHIAYVALVKITVVGHEQNKLLVRIHLGADVVNGVDQVGEIGSPVNVRTGPIRQTTP